jgi:8-oxo-dGTP diphosphatase
MMRDRVAERPPPAAMYHDLLITGVDAHIARQMTLTSVLAAVVQRENRYLICQRPAHKRHGGLWEFPGGKLEPGETHEHAARRELPEELGVQVRTVGGMLFSIADPGSPFVIEFAPVTIDGEPKCLEHSALQWLTLDELPKLELAPSDRRFVEFLRSGAGRAEAAIDSR